MRFKPVPEPPSDLAAVTPILGAVPATAGAVDDCCANLVDETGLETREAAETWLTFLRALELAAEDPAGYRRTTGVSPAEDAIEPASLRRAFRERVYGADAVLGILERADGPLSASAVSEAFREEISASDRKRERGSRPDRFEAVRRERVRRLLEWAVLLELAERTGDGDRYRAATGPQ